MSNEWVKTELDKLCKHFLPSYLINQSSYDATIEKYVEFLDKTPIQDTEYFEPSNYYASKIEVNGKDTWGNDDLMQFIGECGLWDFETDQAYKLKIEMLPELLSNFESTDPSELMIEKIRGFPVSILCDHNDEKLLIDESELTWGNEKIMNEHDWDKIEDYVSEQDSYLNDTQNQYYNTGANIINSIMNALEDSFEPTILKPGFITKLKARCPDLDYSDLLSERAGTGETMKVIAVYDMLVITFDTENNEYAVWYMNHNEAEPWSHYRSYEKALSDLERCYQSYTTHNWQYEPMK